MVDLVNSESSLEVPRGDPAAGSLLLDMTMIHKAESRIYETKVMNTAALPELRGSFNEASGVLAKYLAWIKYEILISKRNFDLAKATVIIDKLPSEIERLKELKIKDNADFRSALISKDLNCRTHGDITLALEAVKCFLEAKNKTLERAYWDCKENADKLLKLNPNMSVPSEGHLSANPKIENPLDPAIGNSFIGTSKF